MNLTEIIRESQDFIDLKNEIKKGLISKSTLLFSKDSVQSFEFAKHLASLIINDGNDEENENFAKIFSYSHPDVKIYPSKDKLVVADSEEIVMESFVKPVFSSKKIFIIKNIDNSMDSAQNKLLKILEEPPQNVYFILTSSSEKLVLPTIKSRCNKIELKKIDEKFVKEMFSSYENANLISQISDGLVGKAIELSKMSNLRNIFEDVLSIVTKMKSSKFVLEYSNKLSNYKGQFNLIVEILSLIIEDMFFLKVGNENARFKEYKNELKSVLNDYSIKALIEIQKSINKSCKEIFYSTNQTLVIENLLLNILEDKYLCR